MSQIVVDIPRMHAGQLDVLRQAKRFNGLMCGRRFGKTTFGEILAAEKAIEGKRIGWFAPTYKILDEAWRNSVKTLAPITSGSNKTEGRIELVTGGSLEFWSLDKPDAGRSRKYHDIFVDEAGLVRNLRDSWLGAIRPTLTDYRGGAWFLGTPKGTGYFTQIQNFPDKFGDWAFFRKGTVDNPFIDAAEIEEARRQMPENIFNQEYLGIPDDDGGNPFGLDAIRRCFGEIESPGDVFCWGIDLAKSHDYTWAIALDRSSQVVYSERWQLPWSETRKKIIDLIGDAPALIDSTGVGDPVVEDIARECDGAEGFKFTRTSKQQLMAGMRTDIQLSSVRFDDEALLHELEVFSYEYTPGGGVTWSAPSGFHDDGVCALALALECQRRETHKIPVSFAGLAESSAEDFKPDPFEAFAGDPFQ